MLEPNRENLAFYFFWNLDTGKPRQHVFLAILKKKEKLANCLNVARKIKTPVLWQIMSSTERLQGSK
jgi:hypothetical protein